MARLEAVSWGESGRVHGPGGAEGHEEIVGHEARGGDPTGGIGRGDFQGVPVAQTDEDQDQAVEDQDAPFTEPVDGQSDQGFKEDTDNGRRH